MATLTYFANNGNDKLIISTILTHLIAFNEAGYEFSTERKRRVSVEWWNPTTWGGFRWERSNRAIQPIINDIAFIMARTRRNPFDFRSKEVKEVGYYKLSCFQFGINAGTSGVGLGDGRSNNDTYYLPIAQNVSNINVLFSYDGSDHSISHSIR